VDAYRGSEAGDVVVAPTRDGPLRLEVGPRHIALQLADRRMMLADRQLTLVQSGRREKREARTLAGGLWVARDVPHDDVGVWEEVEGGGVRRVFGAVPRALFEHDGLDALRALDRLAVRLKAALSHHAGDVVRATEVGRSLDKVLILDDGERYRLYLRPLFREVSRWALDVHRDGRIAVPDGKGKRREVTCKSRWGVTVIGDYLRFADPTGLDLARVSMPWISREDREELARRVGELIDTPSC
jgi:hypothetical protein